MERSDNGEDFMTVGKEVMDKWSPGNEYLWDEYDYTTLYNTDKKKTYVANTLLHGRIKVYLQLKEKGHDVKGKDPFKYKYLLNEAPEATI